jgi:phosphatidylserine/phosphatidylglycerophosphate/cardiolipin synthase-like enzyme
VNRPVVAAFVAWFLAFASCADPPEPQTPRSPASAGASGSRRGEVGSEIELVESAPLETTLDHSDIRDAFEIWPQMIDHAARSIDLSHFYASEIEKEPDKSRLTPVIEALERAAARGVKIRFLLDEMMSAKYPATLERLRQIGTANIKTAATIKTIDSKARYGGVQHAKYMIVDGEDAFLGSQNFDWRALGHIHEMGVRVHSTAIAGALTDVFETDWALANDATPAGARVHAHAKVAPEAKTRTGELVGLYASPKGWLPEEGRWELPRIVSLIDAAHSSVSLQVLDYSTLNRDKSRFTTLDDALRRAAARGVHVRLLVSHWGTKAGSPGRKSVEEIAALPNVEARVFTIPPWSHADIPFARVAHAKYLVIDDRTAWVGTSNWEGDYFLKSRNVAVVVEGGSLPPRLGRVFEDGWSSTYATPLRDAAVER